MKRLFPIAGAVGMIIACAPPGAVPTPEGLSAKRPGHTVIHYSLADEAQQMLGAPVPYLDYSVIAAFPPDPHVATFASFPRSTSP